MNYYLQTQAPAGNFTDSLGCNSLPRLLSHQTYLNSQDITTRLVERHDIELSKLPYKATIVSSHNRFFLTLPVTFNVQALIVKAIQGDETHIPTIKQLFEQTDNNGRYTGVFQVIDDEHYTPDLITIHISKAYLL